VVTCVLVLTGATGVGAAKSRKELRGSAGCDAAEAASPGTTDRTMTAGGVERRFLVQIPERYDGTHPFALVLDLHALTVDYHFVFPLSGIGEMQEKYDFIAVAPSGRTNANVPYWVAAPTHDNYDVKFIDALLDRLESELCIDRTRVFSTGISNGAQMSSLLACDLGSRIAAVAPVAGVEFYDQCNGRPVAVMAFHGTDDPIVTYDGGGLNARRIADQNYWHGDIPDDVPTHHGVDAAMKTWAEHNGCKRQPVEKRISDEVRRRTWRGCDARTVLYIIDGGGHSLPGRPVPGFEDRWGGTTTDIDAVALMFKFFFTRSR
jgi:polyhydroxybutyrate depolymerase